MMDIIQSLNFTVPEILSLIGLVQCVFLVVYIFSRMKTINHAGLPFVYFIVLGAAFFSDLAKSFIGTEHEYYYYFQWFSWNTLAPLSVLLVIQFAKINEPITLKEYWVLLLPSLCFLLSLSAINTFETCDILLKPCEQLVSLMTVTGLLSGAISILVIFSKKDLFSKVRKQKLGKERYWLILSLIIVNILILSIVLAYLMNYVSAKDVTILRTIMGIAFIYLVSTSLLRMYPKPLKTSISNITNEDFSEDEIELAKKIEYLILTEKVYQEPAYSRADLAKECEYSETIVSKVFNAHFQKSFPQVMNENRVEEAKRLLKETNASVKEISGEVGFNSMPSFNRVFKDITGYSPSAYRKSIKT